MKLIALILTAVGAIALLSTPALAEDYYYYYGRGYGAVRHVQDHSRLNHRVQHRAATHHNAHHYPMTYWQHSGLHNQLDHQANHDEIRHHSAHDRGRYYYYGHGLHDYGFRIGRYSFWFGH